MRSLLIQLPLTLTSLCAFAFNPTAEGWYGESDLSPTISSLKYQGTGVSGFDNLYRLNVPAEGDFTLLGVDVKQAVGWRQWVSVELSGGYSGALNGSANNYDHNGNSSAMPASLNLWDLSLETFTSIALDSPGTVYIEPAIGYAWVVANMRAATSELPRKNWVRTDIYGPALALYLRLFLTDRVSVRFGSKYQASQLRTKSYQTSSSPYLEGTLIDKRHSRARRHSLGALVRFDYTWRSWVYLHGAVDYQSWSAGGPSQSDQVTMAPRLERTRFTWGVDFAY